MLKKLLLFILILIIPQNNFAQSEYYISLNDSFTLDATTHAIDDMGNVFILSTISPFDTLNGLTIGYEKCKGNVLIKVNTENNIEWKKFYTTDNYHPGAQLFLLNNTICIPFNACIGLKACYYLPNGGRFSKVSWINAFLKIDGQSGDTLRYYYFYPEQKCGQNFIDIVYVNEHINFIYGNDSGNTPKYYHKIIDTNCTTNENEDIAELSKLYSTQTIFINKKIYDSIAHQFILVDRFGLFRYDSNWNLLNRYDFRNYGLSLNAVGNTSFAYNANYFVVNFAAYDSSGSTHHTFYTLVINKEGDLISLQPSVSYNDILLSNNNEIFGISSNVSTNGVIIFDTTQLQLTFTQMDLYQNVKRKYSFGKPGIVPNKISLTKENDIVVTGTYYLTRKPNHPEPDMVYYYRVPLEKIPLLKSNENLCNSVNIYPNPTKGILYISNTNFDITNQSSIDFYNTLGQKSGSFLNNNRNITYDISSFPSGVYYFKTINNQSSCLTKIFKY